MSGTGKKWILSQWMYSLDYHTVEIYPNTWKIWTVKLHYDEDYNYDKRSNYNSVKVDGIIPGIYSVTVSGTAIDTENNEYYINGNSVNAALFKHGSALNIEVQGLKWAH